MSELLIPAINRFILCDYNSWSWITNTSAYQAAILYTAPWWAFQKKWALSL